MEGKRKEISMIGKLFALPFKILNVPFRATEKIIGKMCGEDDIPKSDRVLSKPLEAVSEAIEEIDE